MTCKVCGKPPHPFAHWFCEFCHFEWQSSHEYVRFCSTPSAAIEETALMDFITRVRLERLNGVKV